MTFRPFERHRKHPKPPHQKAGLQVMYTLTNILFDGKEKRKGKEGERKEYKRLKRWVNNSSIMKANTAKNHYKQTVFNGLLAHSWPFFFFSSLPP